MPTVVHPRIRPGTIEDREYQAAISEAAVRQNTLVVLPTGLGKTTIALRVIAESLLRNPTRSVLVLAPTRPLVLQHGVSVAKTLFAPEPIVLTGAIPPERRAELLHPPQVVVATPQVIGNDLASGTFPLDTFSLIVFDEAHRGVGIYPYVQIARANQEGPRARVLAMTASPGGSEARIREVWTNLGIEHFEYRYRAVPRRRPVPPRDRGRDRRPSATARGPASRDRAPCGRSAPDRRAAQARLAARSGGGQPPDAPRGGGPVAPSDRDRARPR